MKYTKLLLSTLTLLAFIGCDSTKSGSGDGTDANFGLNNDPIGLNNNKISSMKLNQNYTAILASKSIANYTLQTQEDGVISINVTWKPLDPQDINFALKIYTDGNLLDSDTYSGGSSVNSLNLKVYKDKVYRIEITSENKNEYRYNLVVASTIDSPLSTNIEVNKELNATANETDKYVQTYNFTADATGKSLINVSWNEDATSDTNLDLYLYTNNELYASRTYSGSSEMNAIEVKLYKDEKYAIIIKGDDTNKKALDYSLEVAHSNTKVNTKVINPNTTYKSTLNAVSNVYDTYLFTTQEDAKGSLFLRWPEVATTDTNFNMYIYEDDTLLTYKTYSGSAEEQYATFVTKKDKQYSVIISTRDGYENNKDYSMQLSLASSDADRIRLEINGTVQTGTLDQFSDLFDYYVITTNTNTPVLLDINWTEQTVDTNLGLELYDNGVYLKDDTYSGSGETNSISFNAQTAHTYTLRIKSENAAGKSIDYKLKASSN